MENVPDVKFTPGDMAFMERLAAAADVPVALVKKTAEMRGVYPSAMRKEIEYANQRHEIDMEISHISEKLDELRKRREALVVPGRCAFYRSMSDESLIAFISEAFRPCGLTQRALLNELIRKFLHYRAENGMFVQLLGRFNDGHFGEEIDKYIIDAPKDIQDAMNGVPKDWFCCTNRAEGNDDGVRATVICDELHCANEKG